jgi:type IV pilus assembly protein PilO
MKNMRRWFTLLNLHLAVAAALLVFVLVLGVRVIVAYHDAGKIDSSSYQQQQIHSMQLRARMARLQDLPAKVGDTREQEAKFIADRIATNYSTIAAQLGDIAVKDQVRWARAQYNPSNPVNGITELYIDAAVSGDYIPVMHFINDIERDKDHVFFIIDGVTFTGEQGGLVNIRLRLSAFIQTGADDLPPANNVPSNVQAQNASPSTEQAIVNPTPAEVR